MPPLTPADSLLILAAYLLGSVSSAVIVCRLWGLPDPRTQGSGNPGATNVLRLGGKKAAFVTLAGDMLKGVIPVAAASWLASTMTAVSLVGLAAFLGHLYPVFFRFQGGKGVATALGVLLAAAWPVGLSVAGTWLLMFAVTRTSSLSALTAFLFAPIYAWYLVPEHNFALVVGLITVLLFWRHRSNIGKLMAGTEGKFGKRP